MQRGLFLPPGWEGLLASEDHKAMARRALEDGASDGSIDVILCRTMERLSNQLLPHV